MKSLVRFLVCSVLGAAMLYSYVNEQNVLTACRLKLPLLEGQVRALQEENTRLRYQIDLFESPEHLMQLASEKSFSHLKYPIRTQVLCVAQGLSLERTEPVMATSSSFPLKTPLASIAQ